MSQAAGSCLKCMHPNGYLRLGVLGEATLFGVIVAAVGQFPVVHIVLAAPIPLDDADDDQQQYQERNGQHHSDEPPGRGHVVARDDDGAFYGSKNRLVFITGDLTIRYLPIPEVSTSCVIDSVWYSPSTETTWNSYRLSGSSPCTEWWFSYRTGSVISHWLSPLTRYFTKKCDPGLPSRFGCQVTLTSAWPLPFGCRSQAKYG